MKLRDYQQRAVDAAYSHLAGNKDNPVIVLPTGAGKTPVLAEIARIAVEQHNVPVLVLSHVKELIQQSAETLKSWHPQLDVGVYSAGLRSRDTDHAIVCAGIQSVYKKAFEFGERKLVLIDECHLISPTDGTMYQQFMDDLKQANPALRVVGLTATPYRLTSGRITTPDGMLNRTCCVIPIQRLVADGWLAPVTNQPTVQADLSAVHKRGGEYIAREMEGAFDQEGLVKDACEEVARYTKDRRAVLVFAAGVKHGEHVTKELQRLGMDAEFVCGDTSPLERGTLTRRFKSGQLRCLVNVNVLTTGFDATCVDAIAVMRATCSPGLFAQICGRGFRLHEGKSDCLILDFGGNIQRHGPLDSESYGVDSVKESTGGEAPYKPCPACEKENLLAARECIECGFLFPVDVSPKHEAKADIAASIVEPDPEWVEIDREEWSIHVKRGTDSRTLRVDYFRGNMPREVASEWVCLEHDGFAFQKAIHWWNTRTYAEPPLSIDEAIEAFDLGMVNQTLAIEVVAEGKYTRVKRRRVTDKPKLLDCVEAPF